MEEIDGCFFILGVQRIAEASAMRSPYVVSSYRFMTHLLVTNAVVTWNTVYMAAVIEQLKSEGVPVAPTTSIMSSSFTALSGSVYSSPLLTCCRTNSSKVVRSTP